MCVHFFFFLFLFGLAEKIRKVFFWERVFTFRLIFVTQVLTLLLTRVAASSTAVRKWYLPWIFLYVDFLSPYLFVVLKDNHFLLLLPMYSHKYIYIYMYTHVDTLSLIDTSKNAYHRCTDSHYERHTWMKLFVIDTLNLK